MNKLEQQIEEAISKVHPLDNLDCKEMARIAAKIALELAQDAYDQGRSDGQNYCAGGGNRTFNQFIQDYE